MVDLKDVPEFIPAAHVEGLVKYIFQSGLCPYCATHFQDDIMPLDMATHIVMCIIRLEKENRKTTDS